MNASGRIGGMTRPRKTRYVAPTPASTANGPSPTGRPGRSGADPAPPATAPRPAAGATVSLDSSATRYRAARAGQAPCGGGPGPVHRRSRPPARSPSGRPPTRVLDADRQHATAAPTTSRRAGAPSGGTTRRPRRPAPRTARRSQVASSSGSGGARCPASCPPAAGRCSARRIRTSLRTSRAKTPRTAVPRRRPPGCPAPRDRRPARSRSGRRSRDRDRDPDHQRTQAPAGEGAAGGSRCGIGASVASIGRPRTVVNAGGPPAGRRAPFPLTRGADSC